MQREFGVTLDPVTEINHAIGSKPALAMLPAAFINPGDVTLMTVPGYPVAGTHTKYYGGEVHRLPLLAENDFFPDLDSHSRPTFCNGPNCWCINYPNSPTGTRGHARLLRARRSTSPSDTRSSSCRTRPTSCSATTARR